MTWDLQQARVTQSSRIRVGVSVSVFRNQPLQNFRQWRRYVRFQASSVIYQHASFEACFAESCTTHDSKVKYTLGIKNWLMVGRVKVRDMNRYRSCLFYNYRYFDLAYSFLKRIKSKLKRLWKIPNNDNNKNKQQKWVYLYKFRTRVSL